MLSYGLGGHCSHTCTNKIKNKIRYFSFHIFIDYLEIAHHELPGLPTTPGTSPQERKKKASPIGVVYILTETYSNT